ncbi:MAG: endonuclease [Porphyromonadaceae bacterium]|nr:endonuclease [Porphyromonadaceae bacterium]
MNYSKYSLFTALFLFVADILCAQVPNGYYAGAEGKRGPELKTALFQIIKDPQVIPYADLWEIFKWTDNQKNDKVWDMYSDIPEKGAKYLYDFRKNRCGSYHREGDCYNREHILPKSWFKGSESLESDLFHLYPTDGYVNNRRGNLPLGEAGITYWESSNGSKVGQNTFGNYRKTIFEPIDAYKGDFARIYFYVVTAYEEQLPRWNSDQVGGSRYPGFSDWSLDLMLKWHREDPVSIKEVRRNEAVYRIQKNRNPYIDYPELAEYVWGNFKNAAFESSSLSDSFLKIEYSPFERWLQDVKLFFKRNNQ